MEETSTSSRSNPEESKALLETKLPYLLPAFGAEILDATDFRGDLMVTVKPGRIRDLVKFLKTSPQLPFEMMMDLFGMDYLKSESKPWPERFAVVYSLYSLSQRRRVHLKVFVPEAKPELDSIHDLFAMANWFEREAWDMFGIVFRGHPGLHRILCHNEFVGHPMRKDYPADQYQRLKNAVTSSGI